MAGRSHRMDAVPHAATRTLPMRSVCALAALLCTLGLLSTVAPRPGHRAHHRAQALVAASVVADGHELSIQHAVTTAAVAEPGTALTTALRTTGSTAPTDRSVETIRTRGPPATQA